MRSVEGLRGFAHLLSGLLQHSLRDPEDCLFPGQLLEAAGLPLHGRIGTALEEYSAMLFGRSVLGLVLRHQGIPNRNKDGVVPVQLKLEESSVSGNGLPRKEDVIGGSSLRVQFPHANPRVTEGLLQTLLLDVRRVRRVLSDRRIRLRFHLSLFFPFFRFFLFRFFFRLPHLRFRLRLHAFLCALTHPA